MSYLTKAEIMSLQGTVTEEVPVPEWGGTVLIRELPADLINKLGMKLAARAVAEGASFDEVVDRGIVAAESIADMFPEIAAAAIIDERGRPMFNTAQIKRFSAKSAMPLQTIAVAALRISGLWSEDEGEDESEVLPQQLAEHEAALARAEPEDDDSKNG